MGHKTLADKLDQIQREDLGIHFDESMLWDDLSAQLGNKKPALIERRLWIAACITLLILLFPLALMMDSKPVQIALETPAIPEVLKTEEVLATPLDLNKVDKIKETSIYTVEKKGVSIELINTVELAVLNLKPIPIQKEEKTKRQLFANQDISIIRASLGTPSIEKEKSVTLRAQLHTSSQPEQLNNQAFKIKLFDMSKQ